jgi:cytochrome c-type biogenesis protein CcmE
MKKIHIVLIILVAVVSGILVSTFTSAVDNTTFDVAKKAPGKQFKITGTFDKARGIQHDPLVDPNLTIFYMTDANGINQCVELHDKNGKPMGLDFSESVTVEGKYDNSGKFEANYMLLKCPSKYNEQKHSLKMEQ